MPTSPIMVPSKKKKTPQEKKQEMISKFNTENNFMYRMKPNIVHAPGHTNQAIEETQKYILYLEKRISILEKAMLPTPPPA